MAKPVLGKSLRSGWFFLGRDFPWKQSKPCIFVLEQSRQIQKLQPKTVKSVDIVILQNETTRKS